MDIIAQNTLVPIKKSYRDVKFYFKTIKDTYPDPYAFASKEVIDSTEKKILSEIKKSMASWELARLIELNTNSLFDNHTKMHYVFYHPQKHTALLNNRSFFPYDIHVLMDSKQLFFLDKGQMYEILEINSHPAPEIVFNLEKIYSADISQKNKQRDISIFFPLYYYFIYLEDQKINIRFMDSLKKTADIKVEGIGLEAIKERINKKTIPKSKEKCHLEFYTDSIAVLTVNTFGFCDKDIKDYYQPFLKSSFQEIADKKCKYLFIDIKANSGGSSYNVRLLLDYLFEGSYKIFGYTSEKKRSKPYIKEYEDKEGRKANKNKEMIIDYGFFERKEEIDNPFTGTLFLLQSNLTESASLDMSSAIKVSRRGIILGEPTGEPASSFSNALVFEMPNSKLSFQCASGYFPMPSGSSDDEWIQPDIEIDFIESPINLSTLQKWINLSKEQYPSFFRN